MINTIINAIVPIFLVIFVGWIAGKTKVIEFGHKRSLINFVVKIGLPLILLDTTLKTPIHDFADFKVIGTFTIGFTFMYFFTYFCFKHIFKVNFDKCAIASISCAFPNVTFMGIPVLMKLFGQKAMTMIVISTILATILLVSYTVIIIESHKNKDVHPLKHILMILNTPMIIAPIIGMILSALTIDVPEILHTTFSLIGDTSPAIALFVMGVAISNTRLAISKDINVMMFLKNIITPLIFWGLLVLFNIEGELFKQILILAALPTATLAPMLGSQYEAYENESNSAAIVGTILSILSLGVIIYLIN